MRFFLMGAALCLASSSALAQEARPPLRAMTLPEALAFAAEHQPSLIAARARLEAAKRETDLPRALWYPRAGVTLQGLEGTANNSSASYFSTSAMDIPRVGGTKSAPPSNWQPYASTFAGVGIRQELFDSGRIGALETIADAAAAAEAARADADRFDVTYLVEEGYLGVFAAKAVLTAAAGAEQRSLVHRDQAYAGVKSGLRSPIELTRAEADLARFQVGRVRAAGGVDIARAIFAAVVGVPERYLDAAGTVAEPKPSPGLQGLDSQAAQDPFVRQAHALQLQQQAITKLARAELLPEIFLSAGLNGRAGGTPPSSGQVPYAQGYLPDVPNWDVGLVLSWPIFDATSLSRASASRAREQQRAAEEALARERFSTAAEEADETFRVDSEALPALQRSAAAAQANYEQADARFKAGLGSSVELADAEALRLQAEIDLAVGKFEQARARARLSRALSEGM